MKSAKSKYFSNLIANNHHISKALFSVINSVLNPPVNVISNPSVSLCEGFSRFFCDKITTLRSQLQPLANVSPELCCSSAIWSDFDPVSLQSLKETIDHLKPSFCSLDVLPPCIKKFFLTRLDLVWCRLWVNFWFQELYLIASKKLLWHLFLRNLLLILVILIIFDPSQIFRLLQKHWRKLCSKQLNTDLAFQSSHDSQTFCHQSEGWATRD